MYLSSIYRSTHTYIYIYIIYIHIYTHIYIHIYIHNTHTWSISSLCKFMQSRYQGVEKIPIPFRQVIVGIRMIEIFDWLTIIHNDSPLCTSPYLVPMNSISPGFLLLNPSFCWWSLVFVGQIPLNSFVIFLFLFYPHILWILFPFDCYTVFPKKMRAHRPDIRFAIDMFFSDNSGIAHFRKSYKFQQKRKTNWSPIKHYNTFFSHKTL